MTQLAAAATTTGMFFSHFHSLFAGWNPIVRRMYIIFDPLGRVSEKLHCIKFGNCCWINFTINFSLNKIVHFSYNLP